MPGRVRAGWSRIRGAGRARGRGAGLGPHRLDVDTLRLPSTDYRPDLGPAVSASGSWRCTMTCVIQAEGVPAQSARFAGDAPTGRWPWPGTVLPIRIDRADPTDWVVHWDEVPTASESLDRLAKLAHLHASGALTDDEFPRRGVVAGVDHGRSADPAEPAE